MNTNDIKRLALVYATLAEMERIKSSTKETEQVRDFQLKVIQDRFNYLAKCSDDSLDKIN